MKVLKMYCLSWLLLAAVALGAYLAGSLASGAILVLGFAASVLAGSGLLVVYPVLLHEEVGGRS